MISPLEFARKRFKSFQVNGDEIQPEYCPYCYGGDHKDRGTFSLNRNKKTFVCLRGSCGVKGTFYQLLKDFNEIAERVYMNYAKPVIKTSNLSEQSIKYFSKRLIAKETLERWGVKTDGPGNIVFQFFNDNNELEFVKYRKPYQVKPGQAKSWRAKGCKPILYGMNLVTDSDRAIMSGLEYNLCGNLADSRAELLEILVLEIQDILNNIS